MAGQLSTRTPLLMMLETAMIILAVTMAATVRLGAEAGLGVIATPAGLLRAGIVAGVCQLCLFFADMYDLRLVADRRELFVRLLRSLAATTLILAAVYFWFPSLIVGRGVFLLTTAFIILAILASRLIFEFASAQVQPGERLLLIGTTPAAVALAQEIHERQAELGVEIVGFVDPDPSRVGTVLFNPGVIGVIDDIPAIVRDRAVDRVVVSLADARGRLDMVKLLEIKLSGVTFDHLATVYEEYTGKIAVENLRPSWMIFSEGFRKSKVQLGAKRLLDVVTASIGLVLAAPLALFVIALIKFTSPGPIFYRQERVGLNGRTFMVVKFRSMRVDAEANTGPVWAQKNDTRVTPVGRFLRRTRLDEIPQLWNALRGDMSMVGPRPERPGFVADLTRQIPFYGQRHVVKPGVTGWAQVKYTYGASVEDALQKLQYDLYYIKNMSVALDLFVMFQTVKTVVLRRGAS
ncbi:MAG: TIGR03013 family XrtA/PEP-CTERM system glycosyltransferase [Vicinamibacterales bacterium]